jgi:hypothetical protein
MDGVCWWKKYVDGWKADGVPLFACRNMRNELIPVDGLHLLILRVAERVEPWRSASKWLRILHNRLGLGENNSDENKGSEKACDKRRDGEQFRLERLTAVAVEPRSLITSSWGTPGSTSVVRWEHEGQLFLFGCALHLTRHDCLSIEVYMIKDEYLLFWWRHIFSHQFNVLFNLNKIVSRCEYSLLRSLGGRNTAAPQVLGRDRKYCNTGGLRDRHRNTLYLNSWKRPKICSLYPECWCFSSTCH